MEADPESKEEAKTKCPCPICGAIVLEEDINNHLDVCLNRSTVREIVREQNVNAILDAPPQKGVKRRPHGTVRR